MSKSAVTLLQTVRATLAGRASSQSGDVTGSARSRAYYDAVELLDQAITEVEREGDARRDYRIEEFAQKALLTLLGAPDVPRQGYDRVVRATFALAERFVEEADKSPAQRKREREEIIAAERKKR